MEPDFKKLAERRIKAETKLAKLREELEMYKKVKSTFQRQILQKAASLFQSMGFKDTDFKELINGNPGLQ